MPQNERRSRIENEEKNQKSKKESSKCSNLVYKTQSEMVEKIHVAKSNTKIKHETKGKEEQETTKEIATNGRRREFEVIQMQFGVSFGAHSDENSGQFAPGRVESNHANKEQNQRERCDEVGEHRREEGCSPADSRQDEEDEAVHQQQDVANS